jgi:hypothetical protein
MNQSVTVGFLGGWPRALAALAAAACLAGCVGPYSYVHKEQAVQPDGGSIVVTRWNKLGWYYESETRVDAWTGLPPVAAYGVAIPLATGGRVDWEGDGSLLPIAVTRDEFRAYLATTPRDCAAYVAAGEPMPPYVFFRSDGNRWQRIDAAEFPPTIASANLLIPLNPEALAAIRANAGPLSNATIVRINSRLDPGARTINRTGPWPQWSGCAREVAIRQAQQSSR